MVVDRTGVHSPSTVYLGPPGQNRTAPHVYPTTVPARTAGSPRRPARPTCRRTPAAPPTGIAIVLVAQLMLVLDATVVNVALPRIDADLGFGPASLSWVLNAYTLAFGGLLLLGGRLGDVLGRLPHLRDRPRRLHPRLRRSAASPRPRASWSPPAPLQGVGAALAAPERARPAHHQRSRRGGPQPRARALRRRLLGRRVHRPAARRPRHRRRLVALDAVHQRPDRHRRAAARPALRRPRPRAAPAASTSSAPSPRPSAPSSLVWALIGTPEHGWISARTVGGFAVGAALLAVLALTERRVAHPMMQPAPAAQPAPRRRPRRDGARRRRASCRCSSWSCSTSSGCSASARCRRAWRSCR